jgi:hypothetical protein
MYLILLKTPLKYFFLPLSLTTSQAVLKTVLINTFNLT